MASKHLVVRAAALITVSLAGGFLASHVGAAPPTDLSATLTIVPKGGAATVGGYYMPQRLMLSPTKPAELKKEPTYIGTPMYGTLHFGDAKENGVLVVLDENADASEAKLYVDTNHDGDLTNDAPVTWKKNKSGIFMGTADVEPRLATGKRTTAYGLSVYRFSGEDAKKRNLGNILLYYRDYAATGEITLGGKKYPVALSDEMATGHFDVKPDLTPASTDAAAAPATPTRKVSLLIDRDGDGRFDRRFEIYDVSKPFTLGGKTYELSKISADGTRLSFKPSAAQVAEIPIPPSLQAGKPAIAFSRQTLTGKTVSFPGEYKGKVVMLDFWATWCGPCRAELPGLVKAYEKYHDKGFEILGISLDQDKQQEKVEAFLKANNMSWPQVYDGKFWKADVAVMYSIDSIPHAYLVDGDTGKILADGNGLRGEALDGTISKALTGKGSANNR
ncbi:MAG: thioredoxin family protein [Chthonomonadaceae bacterium]|nr:thioredoxin family protein [Chthonomonadaceae bacterium]